jgi:hypothetical protein
VTTFRLRDGEREVEVSGAPGFVRQVLDDLPALLARLRGEPAPTPAAIRMPSPSPAPPASAVATPAASAAAPLLEAAPVARPAAAPEPAPSGKDDEDSVEEQVLAALRGASRPLPISAIRHRLGDGVTGQQVRRILERAGHRVVASGDRPMRYRLR